MAERTNGALWQGAIIPSPARPPSARASLGNAGRFLFLPVVSEMCEILFELPASDVSVLDGYCSATGKSRTDIMRNILKDWSDAKLREATLICRVAGVNPAASEYGRKAAA